MPTTTPPPTPNAHAAGTEAVVLSPLAHDVDASLAADAHAAHLCRAVAAGHPAALTALYELWFERAYALARSITRRDESFCLDAVQEAFTRVISGMSSFSRLTSRADLDRWMTRLIHSAALDLLRRESRRAKRDRVHAESAAFGADSCKDTDSRIEWLHARLAEMDIEDRDLLRHRFAASGTLASIGKTVGMTTNAAYGRIRRALTRLTESAARENQDE